MIKLPYIFLFSRDELYYMILLTQCQGKKCGFHCAAFINGSPKSTLSIQT
ncbi:hypothetical protein TREVI0001_0207 [Treponema vincentii ATCC 35580]|uniref:Uncharacterized protein n=1 Tax=Treponema vincentii ATCC 35580 TaxID=596324 RepID=C8PTW4_9SPIR|nr:hypothetical protein TREVI0001_0207 [Treponema vincentii ATCC 35580]